MKFYEIVGIGVGLAMDAFAVSICKGLSMKKLSRKKSNGNRIIFWDISGADAGSGIFFRKCIQFICS